MLSGEIKLKNINYYYYLATFNCCGHYRIRNFGLRCEVAFQMSVIALIALIDEILFYY